MGTWQKWMGMIVIVATLLLGSAGLGYARQGGHGGGGHRGGWHGGGGHGRGGHGGGAGGSGMEATGGEALGLVSASASGQLGAVLGAILGRLLETLCLPLCLCVPAGRRRAIHPGLCATLSPGRRSASSTSVLVLLRRCTGVLPLCAAMPRGMAGSSPDATISPRLQVPPYIMLRGYPPPEMRQGVSLELGIPHHCALMVGQPGEGGGWL